MNLKIIVGIGAILLVIADPLIALTRQVSSSIKLVYYCQENTSGKCVFLTFDDGPSPHTTPAILDILERYGAKATFFLVGKNTRQHPEIAKRIVSSGNEVANHTFHHVNLREAQPEDVISEMMTAQQEIYKATGIRPEIMRPPFSSFSPLTSSLLYRRGFKIIMWTVSPTDYEDPAPEVIASRVLDNIKPGDIVVMHDGHENTSLEHENTVKALPLILEGLARKNLKPACISELFK